MWSVLTFRCYVRFCHPKNREISESRGLCLTRHEHKLCSTDHDTDQFTYLLIYILSSLVIYQLLDTGKRENLTV